MDEKGLKELLEVFKELSPKNRKAVLRRARLRLKQQNKNAARDLEMRAASPSARRETGRHNHKDYSP